MVIAAILACWVTGSCWVPGDAPKWWMRQEGESCVEYAQRYVDEDLWNAAPCTRPCDQCYWTMCPGTAPAHRCNLRTGEEYLDVIFFSDFEFHFLGWDAVVGGPP
jgi:hypothetical protein